jgi:pimeloyl-ACP methyl ester carboxylesterase
MSITLQHHDVPVAGTSIHVVDGGDPSGAPFLFIHGWPECWRTWVPTMDLAPAGTRVLAVDLPGIGGSAPAETGGSKVKIADLVHALVEQLDLARTRELTVVGHDAGGMVAYAYLRRYGDARRVVIVNTVIPGVEPWSQVIANPYIWHFAFHAIPDLPEHLVAGHQREYFDYFTDVLSADPTRVSDEVRDAHAAAYESEASLRAGFDLYRALSGDVEDNRAFAEGPSPTTPLLYLRGTASPGAMDDYAAGFRAAGVGDLTTASVPDAGHFLQEEAPAALWQLMT